MRRTSAQRHAGLVAQLLAGDLPRCFWSPAHQLENDAFSALSSHAREALFGAARMAFNGGDHDYLDVESYRCTFTRVVTSGAAGVLIHAVPLANMPDPRLAAIPSILDFTAGRLPNAANLHRLMDRIVEADPTLFNRALLFASKRERAFVLLHETGAAKRDSRSWARWPLERLFARGRASIITNPASSERGLAIPFSVPPYDRYVVIAALNARPLSQADCDFLATLECVTASLPQTAAFHRRTAIQDRIDSFSAAAPPTPRLLFYGMGALEQRLKRLVRRRGWELRTAASHGELMTTLLEPCDILLLDDGAAAEPVALLRNIRHAAPQLPVLYFDGGADDEVDVLVDGRLKRDADDNETFNAIKAMVRDLPRRRREFLETAVSRAVPDLTQVRSARELSRKIAEFAAQFFGDWVAVHLVGSDGELYYTELPDRMPPLLPEIPNTFISGFAVMKTRADQDFFAAITDDPEIRYQLAQLSPISGVALPLVHEGSINGTLVVMNTQREIDEPEFEAMAHLGEAAAEVFDAHQVRTASLALTSNHAWARISAGIYDVHVYHPQGHRGMLRAFPIDSQRIGVETHDDAGGELTGTLYLDRGYFSYRSAGYPVPVQIPAFGPAPAMEPPAEHASMRSLALKPSSVTLIYDAELMNLIDSACVVELLQTAMRARSENPAFELAQYIRGQRAGFLTITSRSPGAGKADYPAPS